MLFLGKSLFAQFGSPPIAELISLCKRSAVPILCHDKSWPKDSLAFGTAVILGQTIKEETKICALTCEHVVAIKDSLRKTIKYVSDVFILMNKEDSTSVPLKIQPVYTDEKNDFAILFIVQDRQFVSVLDQLYFKMIPPSRWKKTNTFSEGDPIIYIGYPLAMGIGKENHPLSRTGIVAQLVKGKSSFFIDGFVQHGHSGSPVFLIHSTKTGWASSLIGITTSFPPEFGDVFSQVHLEKDSGKKTIMNPGFSFVTSMDQIIPILVKQLGFKQ